VNVDLCFVPDEHAAEEKLPAVSGSSGHLVIERLALPGTEAHWPGQVFAEADLDYVEAMRRYAQATRDRLVLRPSGRNPMLQEAKNGKGGLSATVSGNNASGKISLGKPRRRLGVKLAKLIKP
jgi:hypothetical protein